MSEPRNLTDRVPNGVQAELAVAIAVLEQHGPAVTQALRRTPDDPAALFRLLRAPWRVERPVA